MNRREFVRSLGAAAPLALAGCGSYADGGGEGVPGDTLSLLDLEYTVTRVAATDTLDVRGDDSDESAPTTRLRAERSTYVVVDLRVENSSGEPQGLPAPSPAPLTATGEIYLSGRDRRVGNRGIGAASVAGPLVREGAATRGYGPRIADLDWSLPPGASVAGWIVFSVAADYDLGENDVVVRIGNAAAEWALRA